MELKDTVIHICDDTIKVTKSGNLGVVEALGIRFSNSDDLDLEGQYFDERTYFGTIRQHEATLNHRIPMIKADTTQDELAILEHVAKMRFTHPAESTLTPKGVVVRHVLDLANEYEEMVFDLASAGKLRWSSGTAPHMVDLGEGGKHIRSWVPVEFAYTPTAAEPQLPTIAPVKSLIDIFTPSEPQAAEDELEAQSPEVEAETETVKAETTTVPNVTIEFVGQEEEEIMSDQNTFALDEKLKAVNAKMDQILAYIENEDRLKGAYVAPESTGSEDTHVKSLGDFLIAVKTKNYDRLTNVYKVALNEGTGAQGGFLVPEDYRPQLLQAMHEESIVLPRANRITTTRDRVVFPVLNQTGTSTGNSNFHGGVAVEWTAEAAAKPQTEPTFKQLTLTPHKLTAFSLASDELLEDSAIALEQLLTNLFGMNLAWKADYAFLQGDGVGKPLGVINSGAAKTVTRAGGGNDFEYADAVAMYEGMLSSSRGRAVWVMNQSVMSDLLQLGDGTNNILVTNAAANVPMSLFGRPVLFTEKLPASGTQGDVIFCDFSQYMVVENGGLSVESSIHYKFINDQTTWRAVYRVDGSPYLTSPITLADGSTTVSPFVVLS